MAVLVWDQVGERKFTTGVDRGVFYYADNDACVPWNGLTSVEETPTKEIKPYYIDGVKYLDAVIPGEFSGRLRAFTYPEEFDLYNGIAEYEPGMAVHDQMPQSFGMSYRTKLGNDVAGVDLGYRIHILYNLTAVPESINNVSLNNTPGAVEFVWAIYGRPVLIPGHRPSAHLSFDTTRMASGGTELIEEILYGSDDAEGHLPSPEELLNILNFIVITDHGDGTWSASGPDTHVVMLDEETFQISGVDGSYSDADTYTIQTTTDIS